MSDVSRLLTVCQVLLDQPLENINIENIEKFFNEFIENLKQESEAKKDEN